MDETIKEIRLLYNQKVTENLGEKLFGAFHHLTNFEIYGHPEYDYSDLEESLLLIPKMATDNLPIQCCIYIAEKIANYYVEMNRKISAEFVEAFSEAEDGLSTIIYAIVMCRAHQVDESFYKTILKLIKREKLTVYSVCAITYFLGENKDILSDIDYYTVPLFFHYKKSDFVTKQSLIRLLNILIMRGNIYYNNITNITDILMTEKSPSLRSQVCRSISMLIVLVLNKYNNNLNIVTLLFQRYNEKRVFKEFISLFNINSISDKIDGLLNIFLNGPYYGVYYLSSLLSIENREKCFKAFKNRQPSISMLDAAQRLCYNNKSFYRTTKIALKLYSSQDNSEKNHANIFFRRFSNKFPDESEKIIEIYIRKLFKDDYNATELVPIASMISKMILANSKAEKIMRNNYRYLSYISSKYNGDEYSPESISSWYINSVMPSGTFNMSDMDKRIVDIYYEGHELIAENIPNDLLEGILQFYMVHLDNSKSSYAASAVLQITNNLNSSSLSSIASIIACKVQSDSTIALFIFRLLEKRCSKINNLIVKHEVKNYFDTDEDFVFSERNLEDDERSIIKICQLLPHMIISSGPSTYPTLIYKIIDEPTQDLTQRLHLLSIVKDERTRCLLPRGFLVPLLKSMKGSKYQFLQVTAEIISIFIHHHESPETQLIKSVINFIEKNVSRASNLLIASICSHNKLGEENTMKLFSICLERVVKEKLRVTAIHAINVLVNTHMDMLKNVKLSYFFVKDLCHVFFCSLDSILLYHIGILLTRILKMVRSFMFEERSITSKYIIQIVEMLYHNYGELSQLAYIKAVNTLFDINVDFAAQNIHLKFEIVESPFFKVREVAYEAFLKYVGHYKQCDILYQKIKSSIYDIQMMSSKNASRYIKAIIINFYSSKQERCNQLLDMFCSIVGNNELPLFSEAVIHRDLVLCGIEALYKIFSTLVSIKKVTPLQINWVFESLSRRCFSMDREIRGLSFARLASFLKKVHDFTDFYTNYRDNIDDVLKLAFHFYTLNDNLFLSSVLDVPLDTKSLKLYSHGTHYILKAKCKGPSDVNSMLPIFSRLVDKIDVNDEDYSILLDIIHPLFEDQLIRLMRGMTSGDKRAIKTEHDNVKGFYKQFAVSTYKLRGKYEWKVTLLNILSFFSCEFLKYYDEESAVAALSYATIHFTNSRPFCETEVKIMLEILRCIQANPESLGYKVSTIIPDLFFASSYCESAHDILFNISPYVELDRRCFYTIIRKFCNNYDHFFLSLFINGQKKNISYDDLMLISMYIFTKAEDKIFILDLIIKHVVARKFIDFGFAFIRNVISTSVLCESVCSFVRENIQNGGVNFLYDLICCEEKELCLSFLASGCHNELFNLCLVQNPEVNNSLYLYLTFIRETIRLDYNILPVYIQLLTQCLQIYKYKNTTYFICHELFIVRREYPRFFAMFWNKLPEDIRRRLIDLVR